MSSNGHGATILGGEVNLKGESHRGSVRTVVADEVDVDIYLAGAISSSSRVSPGIRAA